MAKLRIPFDFTMPYNLGATHFCDIEICGIAYAQAKNDPESYDYDIEEIFQVNEDGSRSGNIRYAINWTNGGELPDFVAEAVMGHVALLFGGDLPSAIERNYDLDEPNQSPVKAA